MLKIGLLGIGHLGMIHLRCIQEIDSLQLAGFYDPDLEKSKKVQSEFGIHRFEDEATLMDSVDIVDIVTPTTTHFELARLAASKGKHLFIEKPVTATLEEARQLHTLIKQFQVKAQVGHVERFNPALLALKDIPLDPMFIEAHRLAAFNPRGTDVSVILDLMIHDLDIVLSMVDSPVRFISASGVAVVSDTPDIANARLEFENGCVANLTASRISLKQMRKLRLFQKDAYISLDFLDKQAQIIRLYDKDNPDAPDIPMMELKTQNGTKLIHMEMPDKVEVNAIRMELRTLCEAILNNQPTIVSVEDGYKAMEVAYQIIDQIKKRKAAFLKDNN